MVHEVAHQTEHHTTQSATPDRALHHAEHYTTRSITPRRALYHTTQSTACRPLLPAPCSLRRPLSPRWQMLWRRDIDAELSGAEDLRYQEAYDESDGLMAQVRVRVTLTLTLTLILTLTLTLMAQFRPKSAEAEAAAAQAAAQAEAEATEAASEAEAESEVEGSPEAAAAAAHATGLWRRASRNALSPRSAPPSRQVSGGIRHSLLQSSSLSPSSAGAAGRRLARRQSMPPPLGSRGATAAQSPTARSSLPTRKWRGLVLDTRLASVMSSSSAAPEPLAGALPGQSALPGQGAAAGGAADGATSALAAALCGGSCASVLESGGEEDSCESVALGTAPPLSSGAAAEALSPGAAAEALSPGAAAEGAAASSAAPRTDEGIDESDEDDDDEGEAAEEAEPPLPQVLSQRWNTLRWSVLAAVRAPQPRPADEGQGEGSTRELV